MSALSSSTDGRKRKVKKRSNGKASRSHTKQTSTQAPSSPSQVERLLLATGVSSTECLVVWTSPASFDRAHQQCTVTAHSNRKHKKEYVLKAARNYCVIDTKPGLNYEIAVRYRNSDGNLLAECHTQIKSVFSCDELTKLYQRASEWAGSGMVKLESIYRCKPKAYFDEIQKKNGGLMRTYLKDNNGHTASSINGTLKGLFFAARLKGRWSFFGNRRFTVPVGKLITPEETNLYFADFYCNYSQHYVTIVVCKHGSEADLFCSKHLLKLSTIRNNFFVVRKIDGQVLASVNGNKKIFIELYYTSDIYLNTGKLDSVTAIGAGKSHPNGLPHNKVSRFILCTTFVAIIHLRSCHKFVDQNRFTAHRQT